MERLLLIVGLLVVIVFGLSNGILAHCVDNDGDGYGIEGHRDGCTYSKFDCDDSDDSIYPGAPELCDGIDQNCNCLAFNCEGSGDYAIDDNVYRECGTNGMQICRNGVWGECAEQWRVCGAPPEYSGLCTGVELFLNGAWTGWCSSVGSDCYT